MSQVQFTTAAFVRSHMKQPKGRGAWAFQEATSDVAFDQHLVGEVEFFTGTLGEAKAKARAHFARFAVRRTVLVAVLP